MHIKNIHTIIEKLADCAKSEVEKGIEKLDTKEMGEVTDMIKDLCEAEYYARIAKAMEESEEKEKKEDEHFLKMLKDEYGDEEGERRFYRGQPRSKTSGRFMSRGDGRRNYTPYYHMTPEMYYEHDPEYYRDMDRSDGRMYYTENRMGGSESYSGNSGGNSRGYSENNYTRDGREGRSGQSRRSYMETKELHKGNTSEDKQQKMKELEKYMSELGTDITEMISDASNEEKTLLKNKLQVLAQKVV